MRFADCHPDRPHAARGLCHACYGTRMRQLDPERHRAREMAWRAANPEAAKRKYARGRARVKAWVAAHPEARKRQHAMARVGHYGVTLEWFRDQLVGQAGRCAICGLVMQPGTNTHIDHDHATGKVRALLCGKCNRMLGDARDMPAILTAGAAYLSGYCSRSD